VTLEENTAGKAVQVPAGVDQLVQRKPASHYPRRGPPDRVGAAVPSASSFIIPCPADGEPPGWSEEVWPWSRGPEHRPSRWPASPVPSGRGGEYRVANARPRSARLTDQCRVDEHGGWHGREPRKCREDDDVSDLRVGSRRRDQPGALGSSTVELALGLVEQRDQAVVTCSTMARRWTSTSGRTIWVCDQRRAAARPFARGSAMM